LAAIGVGALVLVVTWLQGLQVAAPAPASDDPGKRVLAIEDSRNPAPADLAFLVNIARENTGAIRSQAIRALGRLERRDLVPILSGLLEDRSTSGPASLALLVTLRAHAQSNDPEIEAAADTLLRVADPTVVLRHLPYTRAAQVQLAETKLLTLAKDPGHYRDVAAAFEVLARRHRKLHALQDPARDFLRAAVQRLLPRMAAEDDLTPRFAIAALAATGQADEEIVRAALRDRDAQVRRLAIAALNAAGSPVGANSRLELNRAALADAAPMVRFEAVRGWARREADANGCGPLVDALGDKSPHVVLAGIDALGERCLKDDDLTNRVASESRTPPAIGDWQREAHAFLALARRSPERAAISMPAFIAHDVWQVRMYAARAAAATKDVTSLERLAYDAHDNVREATLAALRALKGSESDRAFLAALERTDYQLLRTAAVTLKDAAPDQYLLTALVGAFERVTAEKKDTSRDTRLALLERIREMGGREQLPLYDRFLKDFDPRIAVAAAEACSALSARPCAANPQPLPRPPLPTASELSEGVKAVIHLDNGRQFDVIFDRAAAPLTYARFVRLARARYYDGLMFHRVEPNFVIQGGSPGANEYVGDGPFMRDELGGSHRRGTLGISTRGRDTGDAQIFVNLVDNPRLDYEYTVFGSVPDAQLDVVDTVLEGTRITRIAFLPKR
jgi:cyclophilin family peptidyl-prolyl cis-trans isomerase